MVGGWEMGRVINNNKVRKRGEGGPPKRVGIGMEEFQRLFCFLFFLFFLFFFSFSSFSFLLLEKKCQKR